MKKSFSVTSKKIGSFPVNSFKELEEKPEEILLRSIIFKGIELPEFSLVDSFRFEGADHSKDFYDFFSSSDLPPPKYS